MKTYLYFNFRTTQYKCIQLQWRFFYLSVVKQPRDKSCNEWLPDLGYGGPFGWLPDLGYGGPFEWLLDLGYGGTFGWLPDLGYGGPFEWIHLQHQTQQTDHLFVQIIWHSKYPSCKHNTNNTCITVNLNVLQNNTNNTCISLYLVSMFV